MFKQNISKFEVRCSHLVADPHVWTEHPIRRRGGSLHYNEPFTHNLCRHASNNHALYEANYTYIVDHHTIHDDSVSKTDANHCHDDASHTLKDDISIASFNDYQKRLGLMQKQGRLVISIDNHYSTDRGDHDCMVNKEEDDNFTFCTTAAGSTEFCNEAGDHCMNTTLQAMSPADELFEGGKIRPLVPPIINGRDQLKAMDRPAINQAFTCNSQTLKKLDKKGGDDSAEKLQVGNSRHNHRPSFDKFVSLSAPASPLQQISITNEKRHAINRTHSEISTNQPIVNSFKRCRSLTRIVFDEDMKEKSPEKETYGAKNGGAINITKKTTLYDFLIQEVDLTLKSNQEQQQDLKAPRKIMFTSNETLEGPSLAPTSINLPQLLWPGGEKLFLVDSKKKLVRGPNCPHGMHYAFQKAQAERMKKKTLLPYRARLLGCLGYPFE